MSPFATRYLDSGASNHNYDAPDSSNLKLYTGKTHVCTADGDKMDIFGIKDCPVCSVTSHNFLFVPSLSHNLLSTGQLISTN